MMCRCDCCLTPLHAREVHTRKLANGDGPKRIYHVCVQCRPFTHPFACGTARTGSVVITGSEGQG